MKKWKVSYSPTYDEDDLCHVWVNAEDEESAKDEARDEYHDIGNIIQVIEL